MRLYAIVTTNLPDGSVSVSIAYSPVVAMLPVPERARIIEEAMWQATEAVLAHEQQVAA